MTHLRKIKPVQATDQARQTMMTQETIVEVHVLKRQGLGIRAIAEKLGISRNTVFAATYAMHPRWRCIKRKSLGNRN